MAKDIFTVEYNHLILVYGGRFRMIFFYKRDAFIFRINEIPCVLKSSTKFQLGSRVLGILNIKPQICPSGTEECQRTSTQ